MLGCVLPLTACTGEVSTERDGRPPEARGGLAASEKPAVPGLLPARRGSPPVAKGLLSSPLGVLGTPVPWPAGAPDPALDDLDADGIANEADNCPRVPNPPEAGLQPALCGAQLGQALRERVLLRSRALVPTRGVDPALFDTAAQERVHAMLHVDGAQGGLTPARRAALERRGFLVLQPLPRNTFFVAMPRQPKLWHELASLPGITGLTALAARDRLAPELRLRGPEGGYPAVLDADFFEDTRTRENEAMLGRLGLQFERMDDDSYRVTVDDFQSLERLAAEDSIQWLDQLPREGERLVNHTQNSWGFIDAERVVDQLTLTGVSITVAIVETAHIPEDHPELFHVIKGNSPVDLNGDNPSHAQQVGAIIAGEGEAFPERVGFLPDASLVSFKATSALSDKKLYYRFSEEASGYAADLINYSIGVAFNCNKLGRYTDKSKWRDRAVRDFDILSVVGAGNNGDAVDGLKDPCLAGPYSTLAHDIGKNDLVVGNWDISLSTPALGEYSRTGPTEDGRLKPDLVAPGNFVETIDLDASGSVIASQFGGTSAAAPIATGISGWVAASLGVNATAAAIKGILIHTAQDVSTPGPDYGTGYGLIQAAPAVLLARQYGDYLWQDSMPQAGGSVTHTFQMPPNLSSYKVTLTWTDLEGSANASPALVHDLDLTLEDSTPTPTTYYPWDLSDPDNVQPGSGADSLNNVEQIVVESPDGSPLASGDWTITVSSGALVEAQDFAVTLTPACPITLTQDLTLTSDLRCGADPLIPSVIDIVADGVTLDCDHFEIDAGGGAVGVRISADDVTVKNCEITDVVTGIATESDTHDAKLIANSIEGARQGIALRGSDHEAKGNLVLEIPPAGTGIVVDGDEMQVGTSPLPNDLGGSGIGVDVRAGADGANIDYNTLSSGSIGVRLESRDPAQPIQNCHVYQNHFEGPKEPVVISGSVESASIDTNQISVFDPGKAAIRVSPVQLDTEELTAQNPQVLGNSVLGQPNVAQTAISLERTHEAVVDGNIVQGVGIGVLEKSCTASEILNNSISAGPAFLGQMAISSSDSSSSIGPLNTVAGFITGISVSSASPQYIHENSISARNFGIVLSNPGVLGSSTISGNLDVAVQSGTGIVVSEAPGSFVSNNTVRRLGNSGMVSGIEVTTSASVSVATNQIFVNRTGISVDSDTASILDNSVGPPTPLGSLSVGIGASGDGCLLDLNTVNNTTAAAIHYLAGDSTSLTNNVLDVTGGSGIRLGSVPLAPCSVNVDNATITGNTIAGAVTDLEVLCDVGTYTYVP